MKKLIKKFIGEFLLILGVGLFIYNVFNFDIGGGTYHEGENGIPQYLRDREGYHSFENTSYFYYRKDTLKSLTIGAILITIGILTIRNRKEI